MATVVLQVVGAAIGGAIGGPVGATIGRAVGAAAGYAIDQQVFQKDRVVTGPRLQATRFTASTEGVPIPKVYGRARIGGEIFWATRFREIRSQRKQGGKGGPSTKVTEYSYTVSFAVGLCEGAISRVGRIWADGVEIDREATNLRIYKGTPDQDADPLILAMQGSNNTPAYRGMAYVVFEDLPIGGFGNRIPQLTFEVIRAVGKLEQQIRSICLIPGSTAFGYSPQAVVTSDNSGSSAQINRHTFLAQSDWSASLDELQELCPNLTNVNLVVSWFGDDLRAGECMFKPGAEHISIGTGNVGWSVSGVNASQAHQISQIEGRAAFGSTPSDTAVIEAIRDLHQRGLEVTFYPFVMMDIPDGNALPDPYGGNSQAAFPWRGTLSCHPAIGQPSSADQTALAKAQIDHLIGSAQVSDFSASSNSVTYSGSVDWGMRRMVLHYANLCQVAGGVERFIIGSEFKNLTSVRDENNAFVFVDALVDLAQDVKAVLGPNCALTYAADWSEYFGYHPNNATSDVYFNLDKLWANPAVDAIGVDCYFPLNDWRDAGDPHDENRRQYNINQMSQALLSGEGFDWYYESSEDRENAIRTAITDGMQEPWIWRFKDIGSWWSEYHHERIGGIRQSAPTDWVPQSKPFWMVEAGCPAINKGANQPNVFYDPKSAASATPHFSNALRDDLIQRRYLEAFHNHYLPSNPDAVTNNPISDLYGSPMVDCAMISCWAWDTRPYPQFPLLSHVWSDAENWTRGHWLNGRLGALGLDDLVTAICTDFEFYAVNTELLDGWVDGYVIPSASSARAALEPVLSLFSSTVSARGEELVFYTNSSDIHAKLDWHECLTSADMVAQKIDREASQDLPEQILISHDSIGQKIETVSNKSTRFNNGSGRQYSIELPAVMPGQFAKALANNKMRDYWRGRESIQVSIPVQSLELEVGDIVHFENSDVRGNWQITAIEEGLQRDLVMVRERIGNDLSFSALLPGISSTDFQVFGRPLSVLLDIPHLSAEINAQAKLLVAIAASPWAGGYAISSSPSDDDFEIRLTTPKRATLFRMLKTPESGAAGRWDYASDLVVEPIYATPESREELAILNGANLAAIECNNGAWEIIQFKNAVLAEDKSWRLSTLLRALAGTQSAMASSAKPNGLVVLLDSEIQSLPIAPHEKHLNLNWRVGPIGEQITSQTSHAQSFTFKNEAQRPLTPVHLKVDRLSNDDINLSWIRCGRVDADSWEGDDIPLGEETLAFQIDVIDGATVIRSSSVDKTGFHYTSAQQIEDFGAVAASISFEVRQVGLGGMLSAPALAAL